LEKHKKRKETTPSLQQKKESGGSFTNPDDIAGFIFKPLEAILQPERMR